MKTQLTEEVLASDERKLDFALQSQTFEQSKERWPRLSTRDYNELPVHLAQKYQQFIDLHFKLLQAKIAPAGVHGPR